MVHIVHIKASPKQLSKLRRGHKVRVGPAIQGEGFNLIVHPERYNIVSKTFKKKKGIEIQLTPQEIADNKKYADKDIPEEELDDDEPGGEEDASRGEARADAD